MIIDENYHIFLTRKLNKRSTLLRTEIVTVRYASQVMNVKLYSLIKSLRNHGRHVQGYMVAEVATADDHIID